MSIETYAIIVSAFLAVLAAQSGSWRENRGLRHELRELDSQIDLLRTESAAQERELIDLRAERDALRVGNAQLRWRLERVGLDPDDPEMT